MSQPEPCVDAVVVVREMRHWVDHAVIGLNLCPFARAVQLRGQVHYVVSAATTADRALADLRQSALELLALDAQVRDTTLLIFPYCMSDFLHFNAVRQRADKRLRRLGLEDALQLASFHPDYVFADAAADAVSNCTNRAPYPVWHLLRQDSVERAVQAFGQTAHIYERNKRVMEQLGPDGWRQLAVRRSIPDLPVPGQLDPLRGKIGP